MILTDSEILSEMEKGTIAIEPFDRSALGTNSYDVHLGPFLAEYKHLPLDAKSHNPIEVYPIPQEGLVLEPGGFYLGVTQEYTETMAHIPFLEGKSSTGRLGIDIHATAGKGDIGFKNHWTLEISVKVPVRVYAGMPIGQLIYFQPHGRVMTSYDQKESAKYTAKSDRPQESMMWKNFK
ncbi:MAG: dCTP deaminase [Myxococcales bacterium]|nr:dCTP deaminase [Myxococcales bacterium]|tara:strand:+ start:1007 stop:1543 length:537 start_codon:yes stop_codon:yes gene_type:complete